MGKDKSVVNNQVQENKSSEPIKKSNTAGKIALFSCLTLAIFGSGSYYLYKNPIKVQFDIKTEDISVQTSPTDTHAQTPLTKQEQPILVQENFSEVKYIIPESITNSINKLSDKVARIETLSAEYMNIKADSSAVISIAEKVNKLEQRLQHLSLLSNDGALILTATQLIKENLLLGQPVIFEAEILKQLSASQPDINQEINYIYNHSQETFPTDKNLSDRFGYIYQNLIKENDNKGSWKDRLWRKINQLFHMREVKEDNTVLTLENIKSFVDEKQFILAVKELSLPQNQNLLKNKELQKWSELVTLKTEFIKSLSKISAYSLALMKTESLKNDAKY